MKFNSLIILLLTLPTLLYTSYDQHFAHCFEDANSLKAVEVLNIYTLDTKKHTIIKKTLYRSPDDGHYRATKSTPDPKNSYYRVQQLSWEDNDGKRAQITFYKNKQDKRGDTQRASLITKEQENYLETTYMPLMAQQKNACTGNIDTMTTIFRHWVTTGKNLTTTRPYFIGEDSSDHMNLYEIRDNTIINMEIFTKTNDASGKPVFKHEQKNWTSLCPNKLYTVQKKSDDPRETYILKQEKDGSPNNNPETIEFFRLQNSNQLSFLNEYNLKSQNDLQLINQNHREKIEKLMETLVPSPKTPITSSNPSTVLRATHTTTAPTTTKSATSIGPSINQSNNNINSSATTTTTTTTTQASTTATAPSTSSATSISTLEMPTVTPEDLNPADMDLEKLIVTDITKRQNDTTAKTVSLQCNNSTGTSMDLGYTCRHREPLAINFFDSTKNVFYEYKNRVLKQIDPEKYYQLVISEELAKKFTDLQKQGFTEGAILTEDLFKQVYAALHPQQSIENNASYSSYNASLTSMPLATTTTTTPTRTISNATATTTTTATAPSTSSASEPAIDTTKLQKRFVNEAKLIEGKRFILQLEQNNSSDQNDGFTYSNLHSSTFGHACFYSQGTLYKYIDTDKTLCVIKASEGGRMEPDTTRYQLIINNNMAAQCVKLKLQGFTEGAILTQDLFTKLHEALKSQESPMQVDRNSRSASNPSTRSDHPYSHSATMTTTTTSTSNATSAIKSITSADRAIEPLMVTDITHKTDPSSWENVNLICQIPNSISKICIYYSPLYTNSIPNSARRPIFWVPRTHVVYYKYENNLLKQIHRTTGDEIPNGKCYQLTISDTLVRQFQSLGLQDFPEGAILTEDLFKQVYAALQSQPTTARQNRSNAYSYNIATSTATFRSTSLSSSVLTTGTATTVVATATAATAIGAAAPELLTAEAPAKLHRSRNLNSQSNITSRRTRPTPRNRSSSREHTPVFSDPRGPETPASPRLMQHTEDDSLNHQTSLSTSSSTFSHSNNPPLGDKNSTELQAAADSTSFNQKLNELLTRTLNHPKTSLGAAALLLSACIATKIWHDTRIAYDKENGDGSFAKQSLLQQKTLCLAHAHTRFAQASDLAKACYDGHCDTSIFDKFSEDQKRAFITEAACNRWWTQFDNQVTELPIGLGTTR